VLKKVEYNIPTISFKQKPRKLLSEPTQHMPYQYLHYSSVKAAIGVLNIPTVLFYLFYQSDFARPLRLVFLV
jgi:hypothetical protein